ncbi:hypothetical protein [Cognatiluteimonas weifangensis]|nr:hypothetical protein [Luteimonas weifangensis]
MNASFAQIRFPLLAALLALGGCATLPPPTAELAAAQQALARADAADADQYAADILATARVELTQAQAALAASRQGEARTLAVAAAAAGELAYTQSHTETLRQEYAQRRDEIAGLRRQLQLADEPADALPGDVTAVTAAEDDAPAARLQALEADPRLAGLAAYQRLQAHQALEALAAARRSQQAAALVLAARRVSTAELAAHGELLERAIERLDRTRSELLVEASRREAERARQEAERLRIQAQIQAEEAQRLRAAAEAEAAARQQAEAVIIDVGGAQAAKLKAARKRAAELARQEAELMAAQKAAAAAAGDAGDAKTPR